MPFREEKNEKTPLIRTENSEKLPQDFPYTRAWVASCLGVLVYMVSGLAIAPLISQYMVKRVREEMFNTTNTIINETTPACGSVANITKDDQREQEVQKEASRLTLYFSLVGSASAIVINLIIGPLSDSIGRRFIFMFPLIGNLLKNVIILFLVHFNWNTDFMYLAYGLDGLCGSYFAILVATFSYTADITQPGNSRTFAIAAFEGCVAVAAAAGTLITGYLIKETGFFYPMIMFVCLSGVDVLIVFFLLPETLVNKKKVDRSPLTNLRKVFGFYITDGTLHKRVVYITLLAIFFCGVVTSLGRVTLETIYQLGKPFCWDSVKIGYYVAIRIATTFSVSVLAVKLLQRFMRDETISILSALSAMSGFVLEALADTNLMMYFVPVLGIIGAASIPIARSLMSKITSQSQQGALFASIAVVETVCNSMSYTLYNTVYNATVSYFKGAVWLMMAGVCFINILLLVLYKWLAAKGNLLPSSEIIVDVAVNDTEENKGNHSGSYSRKI